MYFRCVWSRYQIINEGVKRIIVMFSISELQIISTFNTSGDLYGIGFLRLPSILDSSVPIQTEYKKADKNDKHFINKCV